MAAGCKATRLQPLSILLPVHPVAYPLFYLVTPPMQTDLAGVLDHLLTVPQLLEQLLLALEHTMREIRARGLHLVSSSGG